MHFGVAGNAVRNALLMYASLTTLGFTARLGGDTQM